MDMKQSLMSKYNTWHLIRYAYHEVGHAVVWHVVGGIVEEISLVSDQVGYKGYCRFGFLVPDSDTHQPIEEWPTNGRIAPQTITAYYAGMLAMAFYCASFEGEDEYLEGSERDDLEKIEALLLRLRSDEQQRSALRDACWLEAQRVLSTNWSAVQVLAKRLLRHRVLDGKAVHRIIWQTIGYPDADWRFGALDIRRKSDQ